LLTVFSDRATRRLTRTAHGAATRSAIVQEEIAQHAELIRALGMGRAMIDRQTTSAPQLQLAYDHAYFNVSSSRYVA
jgi:ATP-binding cassette subfamily C protein